MTTTAPETEATDTQPPDARDLDGLAIAVVIPCLNEEVAVARVVEDFRAALPRAEIYVYDNNSTDGTAAAAAEVGAIVRAEAEPGKGNVVRRAFSDIEADIYILVDGDATYPADEAPGIRCSR